MKLLPPPGPLAPVTATLPNVDQLPTSTATGTPTETPLPSSTPIPSGTPRPTRTPPPTFTPAPERTVSVITFPTIPPKPTEIAAPAASTPVPQANAAVGSGVFIPAGVTSSAYDATCNTFAASGQVYDANNQPYTSTQGIQVVVKLPDGTEQTVLAGSDAQYGWLVTFPAAQGLTSISVQLKDAAGTELSSSVPVLFTGDCQQTLARIDFNEQPASAGGNGAVG